MKRYEKIYIFDTTDFRFCRRGCEFRRLKSSEIQKCIYKHLRNILSSMKIIGMHIQKMHSASLYGWIQLIWNDALSKDAKCIFLIFKNQFS